MRSSIINLVDAHDPVLRRKLLKQLIDHHLNREEIILSPGLLAALGIGTIENVLSTIQYLTDHPGKLSSSAEQELIANISMEFKISGKL